MEPDVTDYARAVHRLSGVVYYAQPDKGSAWLLAPSREQIGSVSATPHTFRNGAAGHLYLIRPGHSLRDTLARARSDLRCIPGHASVGPKTPPRKKIPRVATAKRQLSIPGCED